MKTAGEVRRDGDDGLRRQMEILRDKETRRKDSRLVFCFLIVFKRILGK